jgi:uncharacterized membrane protein YhaH (DUF805 family)
VLDALKKYAVFSGRASRSEYWLFVLLFLISYVIATILDISFDTFDEEAGTGTFGLIVLIALIVPSISCLVRRLHDTNRSGWWMLVNFVPLIGAIVLLVFTVTRGTEGDNRFGTDPLRRLS